MLLYRSWPVIAVYFSTQPGIHVAHTYLHSQPVPEHAGLYAQAVMSSASLALHSHATGDVVQGWSPSKPLFWLQRPPWRVWGPELLGEEEEPASSSSSGWSEPCGG